MTDTQRRALRGLSVAIGLLFTAPSANRVSAQGTVTVSLGATNTITSPGGAEINAGVTTALTVNANVTNCAHGPCTVFLKASTSSVTGPAGAVTALDYCVSNCGVAASWSAVLPSGSLGVSLGSVGGTTGTITFQLRYRLGWTGNPSTPPGTYSLPIIVSLKN